MSHAVLSQLAACAPPPSLLRLHCSLAQAKVARLRRAFQSPRKAALSLLGGALAVLWLGNAMASVFFRDAFAPAALSRGVSGSLLLYALWHVLKAAFKRPENSIQWSPAEYLLVQGGPFQREVLVGYRLMGVLTAAALKTCAFLAFMWPDLRLPAVALFGAFCGLALLDIWRMGVEMAAYGMSDRQYQRFRWVVFGLGGAVLASTLTTTFCAPDALQAARSPGGISLLWRVGGALNELRDTWPGIVLETPFWIFGQAVTADSWSPFTMALVLTLVVLTSSAAAALVRWDAYWEAARQADERRRHARQAATPAANRRSASLAAAPLRLPRSPGGAAALAWRQAIGAQEQAVGLAAAMAAPAILSLAPLYIADRPMLTAINVMGAVVFYSFLLLPSLLKFDFRRDLDRMFLLKSLPLPAWKIAAAQILVPVLLALGFQLAVLATAVVVRGLPPVALVIGLLMFLPMNCLMFSAENAMYLLYPYRLNEEGIEIFLRTTLVFTAKGIVFGVGAALLIAWFMVSQHWAEAWGVGPHVLFGGGCWLAILAAAATAFAVLSWSYGRFDPAEDTPA